MKLNLGCGFRKKKDFVNIDKTRSCKPDILLDIEKERLPFPDNSVERIEMDNVLEHLDNLVFVLNECHRVIRRNGILWIKVPDVLQNLNYAFRDPFHKHFFTPETFTKYLTKNNTFLRGSPQLYELKDWKLLRIKTYGGFIEVEMEALK